MSKNTIRNDKNCLNCDFSNVEDRFCPKCGQENINNHQSFGGIVFHFFEDLTHYDSGFFKTIKYLIFNPGRLTNEYLAGRRKKYVAPIKLYFFISFITFLIPSVLPPIEEAKVINVEETYYDQKVSKKTKESTDTDTSILVLGSKKYKTVKQLDSIQNSLPKDKRLNKLQYWFTKNMVSLSETKSQAEITEKFESVFLGNLPKAIFFYLPLFGLWLWLFHNKKKWYFFEHAIFTFHYFSFLLLFLTISISVFERLFELIPNENVVYFLSNINGIITCLWILIYFYIAHKRMYKESTLLSFIKSSILIILNIIFIVSIMILLAIYSLFSIN